MTMRGRRAVSLAVLCAAANVHAEDARRNVYGDPFVQVTHGIAACPVPEGPLLTDREARADAHWRAERGTSCWQSGRCRLPNAYLYDRELVPRVQRFIGLSHRFDDTSVWIVGQRRWIWLQGCVRDASQAADLESAVRGIDDVEAVVNQLGIGARASPAYRTVDGKAPLRSGHVGEPP